MTNAQGTDALVSKLADEIIARLDKSYDLVYVDYRDELSAASVAALVSGSGDWSDPLSEWESDNRYEGAKHIIGELSAEIIREWESDTDADLDFLADAFMYSEEFDRVRFEVEDRDSGSWVDQILRNTPATLLRINVIDEDHAYSYEQVSARRVLKDLGFRATRANVETVNQVLANASPEFGVCLGYWILGVDVSDIYELPHEYTADIEIVNPYLYLGNPFSGSGFISEQPLEGIARVKRVDLRTDKDAFGYPVDEVYGGLRASGFKCEIRAKKTANHA